MRSRIASAGVRTLGLEGGKGRVRREGSRGSALCAAALTVTVGLELVVASPLLRSVARAVARVCLRGFCLTGFGRSGSPSTRPLGTETGETGGTRRGGGGEKGKKGKRKMPRSQFLLPDW